MPRVRVVTLDRSDNCKDWTPSDWSRLINMVADVEEAMRCNAWPHPEVLTYVLNVYAVGLRLLAVESAAGGSADEAQRPAVNVWAATPGSYELTVACSEAIYAISFVLSGILRAAAKEISNPTKTDIVEIAKAVTRTCLSDDTLRYFRFVTTNGSLPAGYKRFRWQASVGRVLHAVGIFCSASDSRASKRCPETLDSPQSIADKVSWIMANAMPPKEGPALLPTFLVAIDKSLVLEYLTRSCILDSQLVTVGAAGAGPSGSAVQASLGTARRASQKDRSMAEAHANIMSALITFQSCKDQQKELDVIANRDTPDRAPHGPNVQFFLASHFCAQLTAIEGIVSAMQQPTSQNPASSTDSTADDAGATIYGLAQELLLGPHMRCTEGCADCRYANILSSDGLRMTLGYWAQQNLDQALEECKPTVAPQLRIIGPVGRYKLCLRLSNACITALEGTRGNHAGHSQPAAAAAPSSTSGSAAAAPTRTRPLTQKELRKAQQNQQQQQGRRSSAQPQVKPASKQHEAKSPVEVRPPVPELPEDAVSLSVTALLTAERIHRTAIVIWRGGRRSDGGSDDGGDAQPSHQGDDTGSDDEDESGSMHGSASGDDYEGSEGGGEDEDEDEDVGLRRFIPYRGDLAALARPVGWWKCCLRVLRVLPKHSEFLYSSLRSGSVKSLLGIVMWDPWRQLDITGGRTAPAAGPKASWWPALEADMAVALPLGLLPCLEQLLRAHSPPVSRLCRTLDGGSVGPELLWVEICRWAQLLPLLLRAEWRQAASMVATMGKLLPSTGARSTLTLASGTLPWQLGLGGSSNGNDCSSVGMPFVDKNILYPRGLLVDVLRAASRLQKAQDAAATVAAAEERGTVEEGGAGDAGLPCAGASARSPTAAAPAASAAGPSTTHADDARLLSLAALILARWLPVMPRTLQQLRDAGPNEYGCVNAAGNLTRFLVDWLPLLCQCYRLAGERGNAAAAADWKQLILHDADAPGVLDVHICLGCKDHREHATKEAILALWAVFPAEMAKALAPVCTRKLVVRGAPQGSSGAQAGDKGSASTSRQPRDRQSNPGSHVQQPLTLQAAACSALRPGGHLDSRAHLHYFECLSGTQGESKRLSAVTAVSKRLLTPYAVAAQRLQPPHEVLCHGGCANPHCTNLAPRSSEADLQLPHHCSGCGGRMAYCSKACQEAHWQGGHREVCRARLKRRETTAPPPPPPQEQQELRAG